MNRNQIITYVLQFLNKTGRKGHSALVLKDGTQREAFIISITVTNIQQAGGGSFLTVVDPHSESVTPTSTDDFENIDINDIAVIEDAK